MYSQAISNKDEAELDFLDAKNQSEREKILK